MFWNNGLVSKKISPIDTKKVESGKEKKKENEIKTSNFICKYAISHDFKMKAKLAGSYAQLLLMNSRTALKLL